MKKLIALFLCLMLLPVSGVAASDLENFVVTGGEMSFAYSFDYPAEYVVLKYDTPSESGEMTLHSDTQHFEGQVELICTYGAEKVTVKVESLEQYTQGKATAETIAVEAPYAAVAQPAVDKTVYKAQNLVCEPVDGGVHYSFDAPGHDSVRMKFKTAQQDGEMVIYPGENYHYEGNLLLPYTYRKTNVYLEFYPAKRSNQLGEAAATCGYTLTAALEEPIPGRLTGVTVCVDAGHQGMHKAVKEPMGPGLSGTGTSTGGMAQGKTTWRMESIVALEISYLIRDELMRQGANVVMTREVEETWLSNIDRCDIAEAADADFMLRIHLNSRSNRNTYGIGVYGPKNSEYAKEAATHEEYQAMGQALLDALKTSVHYDLTTKTGTTTFNDKYIGNNWAKMPCFLLELGYMTHKIEDVKLSHPHYQQELAEGVAQGIYEMAVMRGIVAEQAE